MNKPLKIGIIGAGANTRIKHIPNLQKIEDLQLVSVANRSIESGRKVCRNFGIPKAEADPYSVITDPEIDAIVIGTWPYKHHEFTCEALKQGKHVLVEARMAMTGAQAREMLLNSRQNPHLTAQVVPGPMTLSYDAVVRKLVDKIGRLIHVDLRVSSGSFPDFHSPATWRQDRSLSGNNIMGMGIFYETLMRWVGPALSMMALGSVIVDKRKNAESGGQLDIEIPDNLQLMGELQMDQADYLMSFSEVIGHKQEMVCWIHGDQGTIKVDMASDKVYFGEKDGKRLELVHRSLPGDSGWRVEEEFVNSIRGLEKVKLTSFELGYAYMVFTDAVWESMESKKSIDIETEAG